MQNISPFTIVLLWDAIVSTPELCVASIKLKEAKDHAGSEKPLPTWTKEGKESHFDPSTFLPQQTKARPSCQKGRTHWWRDMLQKKDARTNKACVRAPTGACFVSIDFDVISISFK